MELRSAHGLVLRPFDDGDAPAFATAARESVQSVGRWMPWCHASYTQRDALDWFALCRSSETSGTAFEFGVFGADARELLGGAGLNLINRQHALCNLGYWVRESRQRRGIATDCAATLIQFGFATLGLSRIEIVVAQGNEASVAVARKAGGLLECVARNRLLIHGTPLPALVFSLIPGPTVNPGAAPGDARP